MRVARRAGRAQAKRATGARSAAPRPGPGIGGAHAEELALQAAAEDECPEAAQRETQAQEQHALADHEVEDARALLPRAMRMPICLPLRDEVGEDAVDAHRGKQEGDHAEAQREHRGGPAVQERLPRRSSMVATSKRGSSRSRDAMASRNALWSAVPVPAVLTAKVRKRDAYWAMGTK